MHALFVGKIVVFICCCVKNNSLPLVNVLSNIYISGGKIVFEKVESPKINTSPNRKKYLENCTKVF